MTNEENLLEQAIAMSMNPGGASTTPGPAPSTDPSLLTEEEQIALAMQMSLAAGNWLK